MRRALWWAGGLLSLWVGLAGAVVLTWDRSVSPGVVGYRMSYGGASGVWGLCGIELDVVADEKIKASIAVIVEPGAAGTPANLLIIDTSFASDVGKGAVAVVVEENVVSPETAEQVVPSVVVVIADADAGLPSGACQSGFFGDVGEGAVAVIFVQMGGGRFSRRPMSAELSAVSQVDIQPAIIVVIEKGQTASFCFNDVTLMVGGAPDVGDGQAGFFGHIYEHDGRSSWGRSGSSLEHG